MRPPSRSGECNLVAFAFVSDAICLGHHAVREDQLAARRGVDPEFLFFLADLEYRCPFLHDQRGNSFFALGRIGIHINDGRIRRAAVGDPGLCAVEDVSVALLYGFGLQRGSVGASLRLSKGIAADFFSARVGEQEFLLLFDRPKPMNRIAVKRILYGENHAGGSAAARNFLDDDRISDVIETGAAFGFGERYAGEAEFRRFAKELAWEFSSLIVFARERLHLRFRKLANALLQQLLLFGEAEVHRGSPESPSARFSRRRS